MWSLNGMCVKVKVLDWPHVCVFKPISCFDSNVELKKLAVASVVGWPTVRYFVQRFIRSFGKNTHAITFVYFQNDYISSGVLCLLFWWVLFLGGMFVHGCFLCASFAFLAYSLKHAVIYHTTIARSLWTRGVCKMTFGWGNSPGQVHRVS